MKEVINITVIVINLQFSVTVGIILGLYLLCRK